MATKSTEDLLRAEIPDPATIGTDYCPCADWMIVKPLPGQEKSKGGLFLPEASKITYHEGHVMRVGPDCIANGGYPDIGDCVAWDGNSEATFENSEGNKLVLIRQSDVMMMIRTA